MRPPRGAWARSIGAFGPSFLVTGDQPHESPDALGVLIFQPPDDFSIAERGNNAHDPVDGFAALAVLECIVDLGAHAFFAGEHLAQRKSRDPESVKQLLEPPADALPATKAVSVGVKTTASAS